MPIEFELNFDAKIRRGVRMKYGWTQEMKSTFRNVSLKLKDCQGVYWEHNIRNPKHRDIVPERELNLSPLQELFCSNIEELDKVLNAKYHIILESQLQMEDTVYNHYEGFWGKYADWYPFPEMHKNNIARCMGLETREPLMWFDEKRVVVTY